MTIADLIHDLRHHGQPDDEVVIGRPLYDYLGTVHGGMPEVAWGKVRTEKGGGFDKVIEQDDYERYENDEDYTVLNVVVIQ